MMLTHMLTVSARNRPHAHSGPAAHHMDMAYAGPRYVACGMNTLLGNSGAATRCKTSDVRNCIPNVYIQHSRHTSHPRTHIPTHTHTHTHVAGDMCRIYSSVKLECVRAPANGEVFELLVFLVRIYNQMETRLVLHRE